MNLPVLLTVDSVVPSLVFFFVLERAGKANCGAMRKLLCLKINESIDCLECMWLLYVEGCRLTQGADKIIDIYGHCW